MHHHHHHPGESTRTTLPLRPFFRYPFPPVQASMQYNHGPGCAGQYKHTVAPESKPVPWEVREASPRPTSDMHAALSCQLGVLAL
jgi:hypothetical protein